MQSYSHLGKLFWLNHSVLMILLPYSVIRASGGAVHLMNFIQAYYQCNFSSPVQTYYPCNFQVLHAILYQDIATVLHQSNSREDLIALSGSDKNYFINILQYLGDWYPWVCNEYTHFYQIIIQKFCWMSWKVVVLVRTTLLS